MLQCQRVIGNNPSYYQGDKVEESDRETGHVVKIVDSSNHRVDQRIEKETLPLFAMEIGDSASQ
jgi:hypothetical protein